MADAFSKPLPACHCFPPTALAVNCRADKGHAYTDDELTDLEFSDKNLNLHLIMGIEGCTLPMPPPLPGIMMIINPLIWPAISWGKRGIAGVVPLDCHDLSCVD